MTKPTSPQRNMTAKAAELARKLGVKRFAAKPGRTMQLIEHVAGSGPEAELGDDEIGLALELLALARADVDIAEVTLLSRARDYGMSWAEIAKHLPVSSRQAAEQRYLRLHAAYIQRSHDEQPRDPRPVREQRRRQQQIQKILDANQDVLRSLAPALSDKLFAGDTWDQLTKSFAAHGQSLASPVEPLLRAVRAALRQDKPLLLFQSLSRLIAALERQQFPFCDLPVETQRDLDAFRGIADQLNDRNSDRKSCQ